MEIYAMISQPMNGKTNEEINAVRDKAAKFLESKDYKVINSFFFDFSEKYEKYEKEVGSIASAAHVPVALLAKSIEVMSRCHIVYFCDGWENARGCRIEHEIAKEYGIPVLYENIHYYEPDTLEEVNDGSEE